MKSKFNALLRTLLIVALTLAAQTLLAKAPAPNYRARVTVSTLTGMQQHSSEAQAKLSFKEGQKAYRANQPDQAIEHLKRAVRLKPDYAIAHYTLGLIYLRMGDRQNATGEHRKLLTLNPDLANRLYESIGR